MRDDLHNAKLIEGIESCRPGSDDFDMPEMSDVAQALAEDDDARALYDRVQQSDAAVAAVFRTGPVPAGLEERLLAALDVEGDDLSANEAVQLPAYSSAEPVQRRWAVWAVATSAMALLAGLFGLYYALNPGEPLTVDHVLDRATDSLAEVAANDWQSLQSAPQARPASGRLKIAPTQWQSVKVLNDSRAVAYRFGNRNATLLVFRPRAKVVDLPTAPPLDPQKAVSGMARATWAEDDLVYVLILEGGGARQEYRQFVDVPGLAWLRPQSLPNRQHS